MSNKNPDNAMGDLNTDVIAHIMKCHSEGRHAHLTAMGINQKLIDQLRNLPLDAFHRLRSFPSLIADITIDERRLSMLINYATEETSRDRRVDELIRMGASQTMMEEIAAISREDFRERRKRIGVEVRLGRPSSLNELEEEQVNEALRAHQNDDLIEMYYRIGLETGLSLGQVWNYQKNMASADEEMD